MYVSLKRAGERVARFDNANKALDYAADGSGVLVMADEYPLNRVGLDDAFYERAKAKGVLLYVEFPATVPGVRVGEISRWTLGPRPRSGPPPPQT